MIFFKYIILWGDHCPNIFCKKGQNRPTLTDTLLFFCVSFSNIKSLPSIVPQSTPDSSRTCSWTVPGRETKVGTLQLSWDILIVVWSVSVVILAILYVSCQCSYCGNIVCLESVYLLWQHCVCSFSVLIVAI